MNWHGNDGPLRDTPLAPGGNCRNITVCFDANNPGEWLLHCHMGHHAANGMMTSIRYVTNPDEVNVVPSPSPSPSSSPSPFPEAVEPLLNSFSIGLITALSVSVFIIICLVAWRLWEYNKQRQREKMDMASIALNKTAFDVHQDIPLEPMIGDD